jgi:hypothetical protein
VSILFAACRRGMSRCCCSVCRLRMLSYLQRSKPVLRLSQWVQAHVVPTLMGCSLSRRKKSVIGQKRMLSCLKDHLRRITQRTLGHGQCTIPLLRHTMAAAQCSDQRCLHHCHGCVPAVLHLLWHWRAGSTCLHRNNGSACA